MRRVEAEGARVCGAARRRVAEPYEAVVVHRWTKIPCVDAVRLPHSSIVGTLEGETLCAQWVGRCFVPVDIFIVKVVIS